ncbi:unnamed protein product [Owenia fusiformis]|uniref:Uncharacterized protein n=1 Tax=Owenia fusiformis TaxID=6347 RepID=A0A8J1TFQ0_OWEFU|nr:unnamed protein product [Owenia fusiformis]
MEDISENKLCHKQRLEDFRKYDKNTTGAILKLEKVSDRQRTLTWSKVYLRLGSFTLSAAKMRPQTDKPRNATGHNDNNTNKRPEIKGSCSHQVKAKCDTGYTTTFNHYNIYKGNNPTDMHIDIDRGESDADILKGEKCTNYANTTERLSQSAREPLVRIYTPAIQESSNKPVISNCWTKSSRKNENMYSINHTNKGNNGYKADISHGSNSLKRASHSKRLNGNAMHTDGYEGFSEYTTNGLHFPSIINPTSCV